MLVASIGEVNAGIEIHASCASELSREPTHVRTLRDEVARALAGTSASARYTLDVSLVKLGTTLSGGYVEVRAEVSAFISDAQGRARWQTTARASVRGPARDRAAIQRDAIGAAAREVARTVRARAPR